MGTRRGLFLLPLSLVFATGASAAETSGGPIATVLTLGGEPLTVNVSWLQSGGVVILQIVSSHPIATELQQAKREAADNLLKGRPGYRASYNANGHLVIGFRITGWTKPFTAEDMGVGARP